MAQDSTSSIYLPRTEKFRVPTPIIQDPFLGRAVYFSSAPHHYYSCQAFDCKVWSSSRGDSRIPGATDQALFILWGNREPVRALGNLNSELPLRTPLPRSRSPSPSSPGLPAHLLYPWFHSVIYRHCSCFMSGTAEEHSLYLLSPDACFLDILMGRGKGTGCECGRARGSLCTPDAAHLVLDNQGNFRERSGEFGVRSRKITL